MLPMLQFISAVHGYATDRFFIDLIQMIISCEPAVLSQLAILETKLRQSISSQFTVPLGVKATVKITCNNSSI